ncbi:MAG: cyclic nucleotide-binding domain-containing protein [Spirochaetaceae bacterium]|nr:cyclic nucleotide-binding domain-containing protein [Spirochaetaceae bacterium]
MKLNGNVFNKFIQNIESNNTIFREGDAGNQMYLIVEGEVEIRKKTTEKSTTTLAILKKGDFFGEMAMVERKPRSATAIASTSCRLLALDQNAFMTLIEQNSDFAVRMIKVLSTRLRRTNLLVEQVMGSDIEKQVFLGLGDYFSHNCSLEDMAQNKGIIIDIRQFAAWASRHLGIPESLIPDAIKGLMKRRVVHNVPGSDDETHIFIEKRIILRMQ